MDFINHITLNSGNTRKSYLKEINELLYPELLNIVEKALKQEYFNLEEYSETFKGYSIKLICIETDCYKMTLFGKSNKLIPIMTSFYSKNTNNVVIEEIKKTAKTPIQIKLTSPYILDKIEIGAMMYMEAMTWTGDFSRCIGWACLFPEKLGKI